MFDGESAALAGNTSHLGRDPPRYNRPPSLRRREPDGKALHRKRNQEGSERDDDEGLQRCSKEQQIPTAMFSHS